MDKENFSLEIVSYRIDEQAGYVCTIAIVQNGAVLFRDRVFLDSYPSRQQFVEHYQERATKLGSPLSAEELVQFRTWAETHMLGVALQLDAARSIPDVNWTGTRTNALPAWSESYKRPRGEC